MESNPKRVRFAWSPIKVIGAALAFGGIALAIYFDNFAPTAPNANMVLASWLVFAVGMAILLVLRAKAQRAADGEDDAA